MTGFNRPSLFTGLFVAISAIIITLAGCQPTCDSIPTQALAHLRILNAIPDVPVFDVIIDHDTKKPFDRAYYDMDRYTGKRQFGYQTKYVDRVSNLTAGTHSITLLDSTGHVIPFLNTDKNAMDTSMTVVIGSKEETIIFGGLRESTTEPVHMLYLHDETRRSDNTQSLLRFVQVSTDIPGIDMFFYNKGGAPTPPANLSLSFPQITYQDGTGKGTGTSANDYVSVKTADTTLITVKGDLTVGGQIVKIPYFLSTHGLYGTVVMRGRGTPVDNEPVISVLYLPDGPEFSGSWQINYQFYEVRLVNATRLDTISLLVHNPTTKTEQDQARANVPQQEVVFNITPDSVSKYWRLTTDYHGTARFVVSRSSFDLVGFDSIPNGKTALTMHVNDRMSLIEMNTSPFGSPDAFSILSLDDTLSVPAADNQARVRFVNASADHPNITLTVNGASVPLGGQRSIVVKDIPVSTTTITASDGTNSVTIPLSLSHDSPLTVIFTAATATKKFPYTVATK